MSPDSDRSAAGRGVKFPTDPSRSVGDTVTRSQQISLAAAFAAGLALPLWLLWRSRRRAAPVASEVPVSPPARSKADAAAQAPSSPVVPAPRRPAAPAVEATDPLPQAGVLSSLGRRDEAHATLGAAVTAGDLTPE